MTHGDIKHEHERFLALVDALRGLNDRTVRDLRNVDDDTFVEALTIARKKENA